MPPNHVQTVRGMAQELVDRLLARAGRVRLHRARQLRPDDARAVSPYAVSFDPEIAQAGGAGDAAEAGVEIDAAHALQRRASPQGRDVQAVIVENKSGRQAIRASVYVDATGDGDVAAPGRRAL